MRDVIIALDLGTRCGWCIMHGRRVVDSGTWRLLTRKQGEHRGQRWLRFVAALDEIYARVRKMFTRSKIVLAFEEVRRHVGTTAAHVYGGLLAQVEAFSATHPEVEVVPIAVTKWKKIATGNGAATKEQYIAAVNARFKKRLAMKHEDEAAALGVAEAVRLIREGVA